jgi:chemotaxis receptor (MCP) glutamine deamidase CheD
MGETSVKVTKYAIASSGLLKIIQIGAGVGVIIYSPEKKIGAGVHILAPDAGPKPPNNPCMYANSAIPFILEEIKKKGVKSGLSIAIAGGSSLMGNNGVTNIGPKIVNVVKAEFAKNGMTIKLDKTGGTAVRSIILDIDAGRIAIT